VPDLELCLLALTVAGLLLGAWGVLWARSAAGPRRISWGRTLFLGALLGLGASSVVAAGHRADGLAPMGLVAGSLTVAMLWEGPRAAVRGTEPARPPDAEAASK
jgi:hypothetical protein